MAFPNGLLRQLFSKGTRFNQLSRTGIKPVQALVNNRPRKVLNWHSPAHTFRQLLHYYLECTQEPFLVISRLTVCSQIT